VRFIDRKDQVTEFEVGFGSNLFKAGLALSLSLFNGPMKVLHCWGKGLCGACFVDVVRGADRLPERTAVERRKLRGCPESVRLACQVRLTGDVTMRKPRGILRPRRERGGSARAADRLTTAPMRASGAGGLDASTDVTATRAAVSHPS
jgi:ferredoxin